MALKNLEYNKFNSFSETLEGIVSDLGSLQGSDEYELKKLIENFKLKTEDFYRENRKLNIGVIGQVKAGKSSFLNALLFDGKEVLPKASTPKTATLTKMEYAKENIIEIEYYTKDEWAIFERKAKSDYYDEEIQSARELLEMVRKNGINPDEYTVKGTEQIYFESYESLTEKLNDYVGEDGKYTPLIKSVTLFLNNEAFRGISIVDTPGLNDPIVSRTIRTREFMELCDVVFFLSQTSSFLDASDWDLLSTQLPQKGVKKLVLIASKFDSGLRDVLRVKKKKSIFDDESDKVSKFAYNIPDACNLVKSSLTSRAKDKVKEYVSELEFLEFSPELIEVIKQCSEPFFVSSITYNISNKNADDFTTEEKNVYYALKNFSGDIDNEIKLIGDFDKVKGLFFEVEKEKEAIFEKKAGEFIPNAAAECSNLLKKFKERTEKRLSVLEKGDKENLEREKNSLSAQIDSVKADISEVFNDLCVKLEYEKAKAIKEMRALSKNYSTVEERTGTEVKETYYTTGFWFWKKRHYYTYETHYSYMVSADALENLRKYSVDVVNEVEDVFIQSLELLSLKKKLFDIILKDFDIGNEKSDASLFKIIVENVISDIDFPVFSLDISSWINEISSSFTGELKSSDEKNALAAALSVAVGKVYDEICKKLQTVCSEYKTKMKKSAEALSTSLLENITKEFETLIAKCENKDKEIENYKLYIDSLIKAKEKLEKGII